ncbi:3-keto-5-aminohexanoate cleavage protein [Saccharopolyspora griseoalba]|uniref:3-keto-5-aminohexanoate cleavage protein n=1 Tax=Saccharopolyspora griseoalba TaxID=1431848 RepID=A0ABW2LEU3_9PSEU
MLQVCLNGARSPREHFHLPVRPEDLAKAATAAVAAGATDIHLHPKTPDGADSTDPHPVAAALRAVRAAVPGTPVGIPTATWSTPDTSSRVRDIRAWTVLPEHATVDWHEPGADEIAAALLQRGIAVDAGIHSGTDGERHLARSPHRNRITRMLAKVTDPTTSGAAATAEALLDRLHPARAPILLHGEAGGAWPVLAVAARRGFAARIGLEDTLLLPDGRVAEDNAELVTAAKHLLSGRTR